MIEQNSDRYEYLVFQNESVAVWLLHIKGGAATSLHCHPKKKTGIILLSGEALVSFLDEKGRPTMVERGYVLPPASQIGPITDAERSSLTANSVVAGVYEKTVDRESAYEKIKGRVTEKAQTREAPATKTAEAESEGGFADVLGGILGGGKKTSGRRSDTIVEAMMKSAVRTMGSTVGREIIRGVLGSIMKR